MQNVTHHLAILMCDRYSVADAQARFALFIVAANIKNADVCSHRARKHGQHIQIHANLFSALFSIAECSVWCGWMFRGRINCYFSGSLGDKFYHAPNFCTTQHFKFMIPHFDYYLPFLFRCKSAGQYFVSLFNTTDNS